MNPTSKEARDELREKLANCGEEAGTGNLTYGQILAVESAIEAYVQERERLARADGCPCLFIDPCMSQCTCANNIMSGGCKRCCKYGNYEQQERAAKRLAELQPNKE